MILDNIQLTPTQRLKLLRDGEINEETWHEFRAYPRLVSLVAHESAAQGSIEVCQEVEKVDANRIDGQMEGVERPFLRIPQAG